MEHKEVICYDYEYKRPFERSIRYNADVYYRIFNKVKSNWNTYTKRANKDYSILDCVKLDFRAIPRIVLSDIVNSISISNQIGG